MRRETFSRRAADAPAISGIFLLALGLRCRNHRPLAPGESLRSQSGQNYNLRTPSPSMGRRRRIKSETLRLHPGLPRCAADLSAVLLIAFVCATKCALFSEK